MVSHPNLTVPAIDERRQAALDWLTGRINFERTAVTPYNERQLKLDRMRTLLTRLGQPDAALKIVHVAGTKGKGSTSAMIAAMLTAAGYRTGVFSSPHLTQIEERFAVDGTPCTADELISLVDRLRPIAAAMDAEAAAGWHALRLGEGRGNATLDAPRPSPSALSVPPDAEPLGGPTYFEATTAMALMHFVEHRADAAVLEVGLGGRLDATNVCLPAVSVITSISYDHTQLLGNTLAEIAREKAGIIKPGVPVVCGVTDPEPQQVIAQIARDHGCRLIQLGQDFDYEYNAPAAKWGIGNAELAIDRIHSTLSTPESPFASFNFRNSILGQQHRFENLALGMHGPHQAANAAVALATIAELRHQDWCISTDAIRQGLATAKLPGRVEFFAGPPAVVLDTAHNVASAQALVAALEEIAPRGPRTLILAVSHDKDVPAIVRALVPHFERVIATQYQDNPRAVPAAALATIVQKEKGDVALACCPSPREAWESARQTAASDELICIAGSFFVAAEMRPLLLTPDS